MKTLKHSKADFLLNWLSKKPGIKIHSAFVFMKIFIVLILMVILITNCEKSDQEPEIKVTTLDINYLRSSTAQSGGVVSGMMADAIIAKGVVWSCQRPTIDECIGLTLNGRGSGKFVSNLKNLSPNTTYYVRAYGTTLEGTWYGNLVEFCTKTCLASINTSSVFYITEQTAVTGGNQIEDGGLRVIEKGVVWGDSEDPSIENHTGITKHGRGSEDFESTLTGLSENTTYYVRAYLQNDSAFVYGQVEQFTTTGSLPALTTAAVTDISYTSATCGGTVHGIDISPVISRGTVWGKNKNPTVESSDGVSVDGTGLGSFVSNVISLESNETYFIRAYATNNEGTAYGNQLSFTTLEPDYGSINYGEGVTDIDGNYYKSVIIGQQEWMAENLRVTHDPDGNEIDWYCYDDNENNCTLYGCLYTWGTVMNGSPEYDSNTGDVQGICPAGWHVPGSGEWSNLRSFLKNRQDINYNNIGNVLKSCRQVNNPAGGICETSEHPRWDYDITQFGTDNFGFAALPGGYFRVNDTYYNLGYSGNWWSSNRQSNEHIYTNHIIVDRGEFITNLSKYSEYNYFSLRCVRD